MAIAFVLNRYDSRHQTDGLNVFKDAVLLLFVFNRYRGLITVRKGCFKEANIEVYCMIYWGKVLL